MPKIPLSRLLSECGIGPKLPSRPKPSHPRPHPSLWTCEGQTLILDRVVCSTCGKTYEAPASVLVRYRNTRTGTVREVRDPHATLGPKSRRTTKTISRTVPACPQCWHPEAPGITQPKAPKNR